MPVNPPAEYYLAENKFHSAKTKEAKVAALEEMIRTLPMHHGSESMHAQLKSKLAKLKKESEGKKGSGRKGISKEGEAQVCILGLTNSGKSTIIKDLTGAKPEISHHPYTTTFPEVGMIDYSGVKIQLVEIPSTFNPQYMSIARSADAIVLITRDEKEKEQMLTLIKDNFIRTKYVFVDTWREKKEDIKRKIWDILGLMIVYTKKTKTPMSLRVNSTLRDFALRIHKDFVDKFRYARLWRGGRIMQIGLNYVLKENDIVEIYIE